jgi:hypothetical protein
MHGKVPDFHLHVKWDGVNTSNFGAATGNPFDFSDDAPPNVGLKRFGSEVPDSSEQADDAETGSDPYISPPVTAWRRGV